MQREPLQPHVVLLESGRYNPRTDKFETFMITPPMVFYASDPFVGAYLMEFHGVADGQLCPMKRVEN